jgi:hypothetical protein
VSKRLCAFITVGKALDWLRPSEAPPAMKIAANSVRDLANADSGHHAVGPTAGE